MLIPVKSVDSAEGPILGWLLPIGDSLRSSHTKVRVYSLVT